MACAAITLALCMPLHPKKEALLAADGFRRLLIDESFSAPSPKAPTLPWRRPPPSLEGDMPPAGEPIDGPR